MNQEGMTGTISEERIEELRLILESVENKQISFEEALEVGESLVDFYLVLNEEVVDEPAI